MGSLLRGRRVAPATGATRPVPPSDLDDHRDDHRTAAEGLVDPAPRRTAYELAELVDVVDPVGGGPLEGLLQAGDDGVEALDAGPARMDLRAAQQLAGRG